MKNKVLMRILKPSCTEFEQRAKFETRPPLPAAETPREPRAVSTGAKSRLSATEPKAKISAKMEAICHRGLQFVPLMCESPEEKRRTTISHGSNRMEPSPIAAVSVVSPLVV